MNFEELKEITDSELAIIACRIIECTRTYRKNCNELHDKITGTEGAIESFTKRIFFSRSTFFSDPLHGKYYDDLNALEPVIYDLIQKEKDDSLASASVDLIIKEITKPANEFEKKFIRINYDADDYIFHRLIDHMSDDALEEVLKDFNSRKRNTVLPNQKKLMDEISKEMKKRGLKTPRNKLFGF